MNTQDKVLQSISWKPSECWLPEFLRKKYDHRYIEKFESKYDALLPEDFKYFISECNGGVPPLSKFNHAGFPRVSFSVLFIGFGSSGSQHPFQYKCNTDWIPRDLMLISYLSLEPDKEEGVNCPSYLLMPIRSDISTVIYIADIIEFGPKDSSINNNDWREYNGIWEVADSFSTFLQKLHS